MSAQQQALDKALEMVSQSMGIPLQASAEDRMRLAIAEAIGWIRMGAPGRALEVLEEAQAFK